MKNNKRLILSISLAVGLFVILLMFDLLSKHFAFNALPNVDDSKDFIPGFINFVHVENTGAAWGMLSDSTIVLILASIFIIGLFIWFFIFRLQKHKNNTSLLLGVGTGFITSGCFGNLIDRIAFGYVRDFINLQFMKFPVFNVADVCLTVGVTLLLIYFLFCFNKEDEYWEIVQSKVKKFKDLREITKQDQDVIRFSSNKDEIYDSSKKKDNMQENDGINIDKNNMSNTQNETKEQMENNEITQQSKKSNDTNGDSDAR